MHCGSPAVSHYGGASMKLIDRHALGRIVASGVLMVAARALAQDAGVIATPENHVVAPALRGSAPPPQSRPSSPLKDLFTLGPISLHPHLLVRSLYGMGLPTE